MYASSEGQMHVDKGYPEHWSASEIKQKLDQHQVDHAGVDEKDELLKRLHNVPEHNQNEMAHSPRADVPVPKEDIFGSEKTLAKEERMEKETLKKEKNETEAAI
jgi:hypothetical protein